MQKKSIKVAPPNESYDDWLYRTSCEAEDESEKNGWLTTEQVEVEMVKHKYEALKKHQKAA